MTLAEIVAAEPEALLIGAAVAGAAVSWWASRRASVAWDRPTAFARQSQRVMMLCLTPSAAAVIVSLAMLWLAVNEIHGSDLAAFGIRFGAWCEVGSWVNALLVLGCIGVAYFFWFRVVRRRPAGEDVT